MSDISSPAKTDHHANDDDDDNDVYHDGDDNELVTSVQQEDKNPPIYATATNLALAHLFVSAFLPCLAQPLFSFYRMVFGTLYPAYASYKAVKTKNVKEYVKWMMYWIVFALFTCVEMFADMIVSFWLPFYYEMKILFLIWLLSPATKGSSILYRKFVHPQLNKHEKEIDEYITRARDQGYSTVLQLGTKGLHYATTVVMQTALKGQETLVSHLRKSYSMTDLTGQGLLRAPLQYSATLTEVDNQLEDMDSLDDQLPLNHRWQSDGELMYNNPTHSADEAQDRASVSPSKDQTDTSTLRRTRSVRTTRASTVSGGAGTTPTSKTKIQHDDATAYVTLPRASKTKTTTRKKSSKTN